MILTIDTSISKNVKVELLSSDAKKNITLVSEQKLGSQVLLPLIVKILKKAKIEFKDLSAVEVNPGPGSFTGTRVGVAVANALGFALKIPVNGSPRGVAGKKDTIVIPIYEKSKFD